MNIDERKSEMTLARLHRISSQLDGEGILSSNDSDPFRAIIFVEGEGLFISRDWAYGIVDLDIQTLQAQYPGKIVYKIGVARRCK